MWIWVFMLVINLLIPLTMIGVGVCFIKYPPAWISKGYGYRTRMSMKNMDTWNFAHRYCGLLWKRVGLIMLAATAVLSICIIRMTMNDIAVIGGILNLIQLIIMVTTIFPTERALKRNFDENGRPRDEKART